ncbi:MAG: maleylpyruvate isomerase family mycothiol-dependent enzyme [Acidimicrobiales bacterium]
MQEIVAALAEQQDELAGLLTGLDDDRWARPSACEGWSVADVVLHLAQTNEMAAASARGRLPAVMDELTEGLPPAQDVDDGADKMVARDRHVGAAAIHARWRRSCTDLREALLACQPGDRLLWMVGDLAARTLGTTRLAETWIHTGDVAHGLGVVLEPADRLRHVARLAWRTIPYAFSREGLEPPGPVAFALTAPSGAEWSFGEPGAPTVIRGLGIDLCRVASRRVAPADTSLTAEGPDGDAVLSLVRTWA